MAETVVWFVATLIRDRYANDRIALHEHLCGGSLDRIKSLRSGFEGEWPMVDLWARVPAELADSRRYDPETAMRHARRLRHEENHTYNGTLYGRR